LPRYGLRDSGAARASLLAVALRLVSISVVFGVLTGTVSVAVGLRDHSLGVLGVGLDVLADVAGSSVLIWRFRAERRQAARSRSTETGAAALVAVALLIVSVVLVVESAVALAAGSHPGGSTIVFTVAVVSFVVLTPLACAKRRLGSRMASRALEGDGALSAIGAATSLLALAGLALYRLLGWWWPDRAAGLVVAALAAAEAWRVSPYRPRRGERSARP
jgi:divalent metal cation (Fe/Co/Zn/Cd) transporter